MERNIWLDVARGIGIALVVLGHVWRGLYNGGVIGDQGAYQTVDQAIYLFHMPLFFALSGMVFQGVIERRGVVGAFVARIETLIYPLVLWSYVTAFFLLIAGSLTNRPPMPVGVLLTYPFPPRDIFWFMWALFLIQTVASPLVLARTPMLLLYTAASVAIVYLTTLAPLDGTLQPAIWNLPYFLCGVVSVRLLGIGGSQKPGFAGILAAVLAFVAAQAWIYLYPETFRAFSGFVASGVATAAFCYLVPVATPLLSSAAAGGLAFLGRISMPIFLTHVFFFAAVRIVLVKIGVDALAVQIAAGLVAGLVGPIAVYLVARRFKLLRVLALGRQSEPKRTLNAGAVRS